MSNKRSYSHSLITYLPKCAIEDILLNNFPYLTHYAYIYHDKDDCVAHWHVLLHLSRNMTSSACCSRFTSELFQANTFSETIKTDGIAAYLLHQNEPNKHQYSIDEVYSNDFSWWLNQYAPEIDKNQTSINVIDDLINGLHPRELLQKYGRDVVVNYQKYKFFAELIKTHDYRNNPKSYYDELQQKEYERLKQQADELGITLK